METRIRNIPENLWRRFRALCVLQGQSVNEKIIELVAAYVEKSNGKGGKAPK